MPRIFLEPAILDATSASCVDNFNEGFEGKVLFELPVQVLDKSRRTVKIRRVVRILILLLMK